jgi:two-component system response regulator RegA
MVAVASATPSVRSLRKVLVLEDDRPLCSAIARVVRSWGAEVWECHTLEEAREWVTHDPDLVIADLWLDGECAVGFVEHVTHRRPAPAVVAISGRASTEEAFRLGQLGVRVYLPKPLFQEVLVDKIEEALREAPDVEPHIAGHVGKTSLKDMQSNVRVWMLEQALARAHGSRSGAARLLQVTRQAIQQVFHRRPPPRRPAEREPGDGREVDRD